MADTREDYRRQAYEDRLDHIRPDCCRCCPCQNNAGTEDGMPEDEECDDRRNWVLTETTVYGDDADGRRGVPLYIFECKKCGNEREVLGG